MEESIWTAADESSEDRVNEIYDTLDEQTTSLWEEFEVERDRLVAQLEAAYQARADQLEAAADEAATEAYWSELEQLSPTESQIAAARLTRLRAEATYHTEHGTHSNEWARDETLAEIGHLWGLFA